jgi:hypothetical protein
MGVPTDWEAMLRAWLTVSSSQCPLHLTLLPAVALPAVNRALAEWSRDSVDGRSCRLIQKWDGRKRPFR